MVLEHSVVGNEQHALVVQRNAKLKEKKSSAARSGTPLSLGENEGSHTRQAGKCGMDNVIYVGEGKEALHQRAELASVGSDKPKSPLNLLEASQRLTATMKYIMYLQQVGVFVGRGRG